jgi:hypothetical protein
LARFGSADGFARLRGQVMEKLLYTKNQYERLREYLRTLYDTHGIKSSLVIQAISEVKGEKAAVPTRTDLDKLRRGENKEPKGVKIENLWEAVHTKYGELLGIGPDGLTNDAPRSAVASPGEADHSFFEALSRFYYVHQDDNTRLIRFLTGRFVFYHFSEMLLDHGSPPKRAIVVGQFDIAATGKSPPVVEVIERQACDGRLGPSAMTETYEGYCLPKGSNLCFVLRDNRKETPKFYTFHKRFEDGAPARTTWMRGYMLKPTDGDGCFHSPVFAERAPDGGVECNVLARSEIEPRILRELERAQPVRDW